MNSIRTFHRVCSYPFRCRRNAEMEKEIADLRRRLSSQPEYPQSRETHEGDDMSQSEEEAFARQDAIAIDRPRPLSVPAESLPPPGTPLNIKRDVSIVSQDDNTPWRLEDITLSRARVARLFEQ